VSSTPTSARRQPPELFDRLIAKAIDVAITFLLLLLVPPVGTLFGVLYWLICDGLFGGASLGKHAVGLLVLNRDARRPANLKEGAFRNVPFALPTLLLILPAGPVFATIVGLPILLLESYFLLSDPQQLRLGDVFADSCVVSTKPRRKKKTKRVKGPFEGDSAVGAGDDE
jgi:uncharacterized RDD family membrane protein YckC